MSDDGGHAAARIRRIDETIARLAAGTIVSPLDGSVHAIAPVAVPPSAAEALARWVQREGAAQTLEVGLGYGVSTLHLCRGLLAVGAADARHVAIDAFQRSRFADCGLAVLREAGLDDIVEFHHELSELVLPRLLADGRRFDLAFVDGNHRFDGVFVDLVYAGRLVCKGGIVIVDDLQLPAVAHAVSFCTSNLGWTVEEQVETEPDHHWAALRTPHAVPERSWDHFVDF